ncbi:cell envelope biogenesis protein OmpA [Acinetobacter pittii]|uniref:Cell envelope biogenesis protein OmpA n=1 Tax=Acinetobacter pittii TaxID=48296 RepID=A0AAE8GEB8_ACIPI|nr:OmpA family protein [Acinetobacter pittii]RZH28090.1 cell envelope biogenesis protein OmpA [Acinetobacter pittii]
MYKLRLLVIAVSIGLSACAANNYSQPTGLRFQEGGNDKTQVINVKRDDKLCAEDAPEKQNCPINFYIDNIQSGSFYINNAAQYRLKPEIYNFKVKNCTSQECQSCDVDLQTNQLSDNNLTLSIDKNGKPYILNNGKELVCSKKEETPTIEHTSVIQLSADTLFKFDGSTLNDLLPKGHQEVMNLASKISQGYVSVSAIKLTGHTDRLGNDNYNQKLAQSRADTVRNLLIQNGVSDSVISTTSMGEAQPVTDGCPNAKSQEALKACLQPDRRVTVEITGISK